MRRSLERSIQRTAGPRPLLREATTPSGGIAPSLGSAAAAQCLAGDHCDGLGPLVQLDQALLAAGAAPSLLLFGGSNARLAAARAALEQVGGGSSGEIALALLRHTHGELPEPLLGRMTALLRGGASLPEAQVDRFSAAMGHDLSHVRVHDDAAAHRTADALSAKAFAVGHDLFFAAGRYAPGTPEGDRLLAHELTHVVQHDEGRLSGRHGVSDPSDPRELEAYGNENRVLSALSRGPEPADGREVSSAPPPIMGEVEGDAAAQSSEAGVVAPTDTPLAGPSPAAGAEPGVFRSPRPGAARQAPDDRGSGRHRPEDENRGDFQQPYTSVLEAAEAEAFLWATLVPSSAAMFGAEVSGLWVDYLSREPGDSLSPKMFRESDRSAVAFGFKWCTEVASEQEDVLDEVVRALSGFSAAPSAPAAGPRGGRPAARSSAAAQLGGPTTLPANEWRELPMSQFVDTAASRDISFNNPFDIPGHVAGGTGSSDAGPDQRFVDGTVRLFRRTDETGATTEVIVAPTVSFVVKDCIDFVPGQPGTGLEQHLTIPLSRLEATGWAYDVPFQVEFTGPATQRIVPASQLGGAFAPNPDDAQRRERQREQSTPRDPVGTGSRLGTRTPDSPVRAGDPADNRRRDL